MLRCLSVKLNRISSFPHCIFLLRSQNLFSVTEFVKQIKVWQSSDWTKIFIDYMPKIQNMYSKFYNMLKSVIQNITYECFFWTWIKTDLKHLKHNCPGSYIQLKQSIKSTFPWRVRFFWVLCGEIHMSDDGSGSCDPSSPLIRLQPAVFSWDLERGCSLQLIVLVCLQPYAMFQLRPGDTLQPLKW